jgi:glycosyltransferase involved in cell wall biosynthesis
VIFSPGELARDLARGLAAREDIDLTLFTAGEVDCGVKCVAADWSGLEAELAGRGYGLTTLMAKHPALFVAMARQLQAEIIAAAYAAANRGEFDLVHIYTNEEDLGLQFAELCSKPVLFTHHDPYNFLVKYKSVFERYKQHNFISMSIAQQATAPKGMNFIANIYHGLDEGEYQPSFNRGEYLLYSGRIVAEKGVELAVAAARRAGLPLKIMGKYYKDDYFTKQIEPNLGDGIEYVGFLQGEAKEAMMRGAVATIMPSRFSEPFGMVAIESLALGTPVIASRNGALPEIIKAENGRLIEVATVAGAEDGRTVAELAEAMQEFWQMDEGATKQRREAARASFINGFTLRRVCTQFTLLDSLR